MESTKKRKTGAAHLMDPSVRWRGDNNRNKLCGIQPLAPEWMPLD